MEAVKKGVAQRLGFRPFFFRPPEWPYFDVIYVLSFYERLIGRKDSKPKMFEIHITLPSQKNGDYRLGLFAYISRKLFPLVDLLSGLACAMFPDPL